MASPVQQKEYCRNSDRVRRVIEKMRQEKYPNGTGFTKSHIIEGGKTFFLLICMSKMMAFALIKALYISIDTSFKHVHGKWQEFEMETWDSRGMKSIVGARAFTTSQSAKAHFILFTPITGLPVQFRHIHGYGFNIWIADAHKGQALGAGMYCQKVCKDLFRNDPTESNKILKDLMPYDHLKRFYRLCTVHFKRNIYDLQKQESVSGDILDAMLSLSSTSKINMNLVQNTIKNGGPKAKDVHRFNISVTRQVRSQQVIASRSPKKSPQKKDKIPANISEITCNSFVHRSITKKIRPSPYPPPEFRSSMFNPFSG
ncbi:hypothetical protein BDQ17DRAFT_1338866 [Cyathus striatus]|nr:hypothetical protein BDQ17DRAFT_1338866 [Cyathus striatus]